MNTPFTSRDLTENGGTRTCPPRTGQARSTSRTVKRGGVCPGQNGTAARRADFGPDYQSPSLASLPSRRTGAPGHTACGLCCPRAPNRVTPEETTVREEAHPSGAGTSLVTALALHGVARPGATGTVRMRSHLASPLRPGRGVLIRSVSRRLGSVAYVREDASPNEVSRFSTGPSMPGAKLNVNSALTGVSLCCSSPCQHSPGRCHGCSVRAFRPGRVTGDATRRRAGATPERVPPAPSACAATWPHPLGRGEVS